MLLVFALMGLEAIANDPNNPNILMIVVDDLNDWVGVMNAS